MKKPISAKWLTIKYFSLVATAIVAVHYSVFEVTTEDLEQAFVKNQFAYIHRFAEAALEREQPSDKAELQLTLSKVQNTNQGFIEAIYIGSDSIPSEFGNLQNQLYEQIVALEINDDAIELFQQKMPLTLANGETFDALYLLNHQLYELSEEQMMQAHAKQILISLLLLASSLIVVVKISERLTNPISDLSQSLSEQTPERLDNTLQLSGVYTQELENLLRTFNTYQTHIHDLIERERSFNRYASHELRSPLMVVKGVGDLLAESNDPLFIEKQRLRLIKASDEMSDFIETLLSLTRNTNQIELNKLDVSEVLVAGIITQHEHLISHKPVTSSTSITADCSILMPEAAFHILLSNLIKNAFTYTKQGYVNIDINQQQLRVRDTGIGVNNEAEYADSVGLGLLLVRDICRQFKFEFKITNNHSGGTDATIYFK